MAYSYYYISTHPVFKTKRHFSLDEAQAYHKEMWTWMANNLDKKIEEWPGFESNGGSCPIGFMYKFTCDLTKDRLGVRRCSECPYKWIDRDANRALGRWSPWHWCDYPGALMNRFHHALELEEFEVAKQVALEIANMTLSVNYASGVVVTTDRPTYDELVEKLNKIERGVDLDRMDQIERKVDDIEPRVKSNEDRIDVVEKTEDQVEALREARRNVTNGT